jgi:predicted ester cyclase
MADKATLARSLYEAWNKRDFDYLAGCITPDGTITDVGSGQTFRGPDGVREYNTAWADAFPDGRITVDRVIAAGDLVVVEYTGRGTHAGMLHSPAGSLAATGRSVALHLCDVIEFEGDSVRAQRSYFDSGSLMAQLGLGAGQSATA